MEFWRKLIGDLEVWADSPYRKSLVLRGARQVGKTTAVRMFAQQFDVFIELNLEQDQDRELFFSGTEVQKVFNRIKIAKNIESLEGKVLLFIDEIQYSPNALLSLRYFHELIPELFVVAAGSLLEAYLARGGLQVSVGRIEYLWVYPLDFEEFLNAIKMNQLRSAMSQVPFPDYLHSLVREKFSEFCMVGGMPEAVKIWLETADIVPVRKVQASIVETYSDDVSKYTQNDTQKELILQIMQVAYYQIGKRITFTNFAGSDQRVTAIKQAFRLLSRVNLFELLYPTSALSVPAIPNLRRQPKLLAYDLGMVNYVVGIQDRYYGDVDLHSIFKGAAVEQIVGQQLLGLQKRGNFKLHYWVRNKRNSSAEIDYLIDWQSTLIPIEVKAGKVGSLKSLFIFMEDSDVDIAVRIYDGVTKWETLCTASGRQFKLLNLHLGLTCKILDYLNQEPIDPHPKKSLPYPCGSK